MIAFHTEGKCTKEDFAFINPIHTNFSIRILERLEEIMFDINDKKIEISIIFYNDMDKSREFKYEVSGNCSRELREEIKFIFNTIR